LIVAQRQSGSCQVAGERQSSNRPAASLLILIDGRSHHVCRAIEAGHVSGRIIKVHRKNVTYKGYVHHASKDEPQYEIESDKTDHVALQKGTALKFFGRR